MPQFAVRRPVTTIMIAVGVLLIGVIAWTRIPQELFPPLTYPQLSVVTRYKDAAPEEIELLVTNLVEEAVGTVPGLKRTSSLSREEVSLVIAEFTWGTNMDFASLAVREKLDLIKEKLPRGSEDPVVIKYNPFDRPVLILNVSGNLPSYELLPIVRQQIKDVLEKVEGVASVVVTGGVEREIMVEVDQGRLTASRTSIVAINEALAKANLNYPAGTIKEAFYEYLIRTIGEFTVVPEIQQLPVNVEEEAKSPARSGQAEEPLRREQGIVPSPRLILLKDVAVVRDTHKERTSISRFNGRENISLALQKQSGANTVQVATRVLRALTRIKGSLPPGVQVHVAADQSVAIRQAVRGVASAAGQGALLAFFVLLVFLRHPWAALNVTAAIPLSILLTLGAMYFAGISINVISMGGLALGVGLLVDAGIVVVENIARHRQALGKPPPLAAVEGAQEVSSAIVGTVLTTIVVFLPLIFVVGIVGQLFRELAFTVTFSNLASLFVSLTLTVLFASWIRLRRQDASPSPSGQGVRTPPEAPHQEGAGWMARRQRALVRWFLDHRWLGIAAVVAAFALSTVLFVRLPREFLPKVDQGQFTLKVDMPPGTRLVVTDRVIRRIETQLRAHPAVQDVTVVIGSTKGEAGSELVETLGPHQAQVVVGLKPRGKRAVSTDAVIRQLRASLDAVTVEGAQMEFLLEDSALKATALGNAPIVVEIRGEQLATLESLAKTVEEDLGTVPGLYGVRTSLVPPSPETKVRIMKDRAAQYHLSVSDIALTAQTAVKGFIATKFKEAGREIDVRVRLRPQDRANLSRVRRLVVRSPLQMDVPLAEVAYLVVGKGPTEIRRQDRERTVLVTANLSQRPFGEAAGEVMARIRRLSIPPKVEVKLSGEHEEMQESFKSLGFAVLLAFLLVYMVMAATFESLWQPLLIMATIPMSLIGIVSALWVTSTPVSAMVGLGIMLLAGIVVDNGIVLIDFVNQRQRTQGVPLEAALLEATETRTRPILMTAATTVLGVLPLALGLEQGAELQGPMAITIIGGLASSTFLTLVFLPTIFLASAEWLAAVFPRGRMAPVPIPALALAGAEPGPPASSLQLAVDVPEIPADFGREDAVPTEPAVELPPLLSSLGVPEPPEARLPGPPIMPPSLPSVTPPAMPPVSIPPLPMPAPSPIPPPAPSLRPNSRQQWLLEQLKTVGRLSRKEYAAQQGISIPTAARDLKALADAGLIRGVGPLGPGRQYELTTPP